jgi:general stress protein YciG
MFSDKTKAAKMLGALGGKANVKKHGKKRMAEIGRLGGLQKKAKRMCWYCQEKPVCKESDLFCSKCVKLNKKDVPRAEQENFFDRV